MAKGPDRLLRWMLRFEQPAPLDLDHPAQEDIAWAADRIRDLEAEMERLKALASQINTDWIPANKKLSARAKSAEAKLRSVCDAIRRHELNIHDEQDAYNAICEVVTNDLKDRLRGEQA